MNLKLDHRKIVTELNHKNEDEDQVSIYEILAVII